MKRAFRGAVNFHETQYGAIHHIPGAALAATIQQASINTGRFLHRSHPDDAPEKYCLG